MKILGIWKEFLDSDLTVISRVILFSIGFLLLNLAFLAFFAFGYNYLISLLVTWLLIISAFILMVLSVIVNPKSRTIVASDDEKRVEGHNFRNKDNRSSKFVIPAAFSIALFGIMCALQNFVRLPGTDEINIDYYAGYLILHGVNPYIAANMKDVFAFTGFPLYLTTPILTGGYVTSLGYPALAAIIMVPAAEFNLHPGLVPLFFSASTFLLLYLFLGSRKGHGKTALIALLAVLSVYYSYIATGGTVDSIWVFFAIFSYITRKKPILSGVFFGIAIALKQLPIILLPFLLILFYFENGKRLKRQAEFLTAAFGAFLIPNLPFLIASPIDWLKGVTSVVTTPLMGVGFGPSALAFMGYARIPPVFFTFMMILVFLFLIGFYIIHFDRLKYAFFVFPIVILIFNFRVETDYLNVWPLLLLPVFGEIFIDRHFTKIAVEAFEKNAHGKKHFLQKHIRAVATILLTVAIVASAASTGVYLSEKQPAPTQFTITSIVNYTVQAHSGKFISSMTVALYYQPEEGNGRSIPGLFAIYIPSNSSSIFSGVLYPLLWSSEYNITPGNNTITIRPDFNYDLIPSNTSFEIMEYYGYNFSYLRSTGLS